MFLREDEIGAEVRGRRCGEIGSDEIGIGNVARGRRGALDYCTVEAVKVATGCWAQ
jgi:hypothetical protein